MRREFALTRRVLDIRSVGRIRKQVPVLIFEHDVVGRRFLFFKKYADNLLFIGKLPVLKLFLLGLGSISKWTSGRLRRIMEDELEEILSIARLDDKPYEVIDFFMKRKQLVIYVTLEQFRKTKLRTLLREN